MSCRWRRFLLVMLAVAVAEVAQALNHSRTPIEIPMPDVHPGTGQTVRLTADLYRPRSGTGPWPTVLIQTPYGKLNFQLSVLLDKRATDPLFNSPHYAFVVMDWRGFFGSAAMKYDGSPPTERDGYEAIEWISRQPWCVPGRVATWGASALGNIQMRTAAERPPSLVCAVPMEYHWREWYDQAYPGGIYAWNRNEFVYQYFGGLSFIRSIPLRNAVWDSLEAATGDPGRIDVPMLHITGWYDHETVQTVREMREVAASGGPRARGTQRLSIGPWAHGSVGEAPQGQLAYPAAEFADSQEVLRFFDFYLRGVANGWETRAPVRVFLMNEDRWLEGPDWPLQPVVERIYHLHPDRSLRRAVPPAGSAALTWQANPASPVPTVCGALVDPEPGQTQGPGDLRSLEARSDVVSVTTPTRREPLVIVGQPRLRAWVAASAVDFDLHARLTQVGPDGRILLLADGARRVSLRSGYQVRELLSAGQVVEVEVEFPPLAATIPDGHALRVLLSASNFDRLDANPQDGSTFSDSAGAVAQVADVSVFCDAARPTRLLLPEWRGPEPDEDRDGLPDWWESRHYGSVTAAVPEHDSDGDTFTAASERAAGTDPRDPQSRPEIARIGWLGGGGAEVRLQWSSVEERTYELEESSDLRAWTTRLEGLAPTPPWNEASLSPWQPSGPSFVRIRAVR